MDTSWITPGAPVVIYRADHTVTKTFYVTSVKSVAAKSFTVDQPQVTERFSLATLETKRLGGTWNAYRYVAVQVGSEQHKKLERVASQARAISDAHGAVEVWLRNRADAKAAREAASALLDAAHHIEMGGLS